MKLIISWFKLKHNVIAVIMLLLCIARPSLSQGWQWANQIGTLSYHGFVDGQIITDGENSYLIGDFSGVLFLKTDTLCSFGFDDLLVIKYDQNGNEIWAKGFGGDNDDWEFEDMNGVYDTNCDCIYLAGKVYNSTYLSPSITLAGNSYKNLFIAKLDMDGTFQWGKMIDSSTVLNSFNTNLAYIFTMPAGDIIIAGSVEDTTFIDTVKIIPGGYLARFDNNGNCKWVVNKFSGPEKCKISISFIGSDIIIGGSYDQSPSVIDTATLISSGGYDGYLTRMDSSGNVIWIKNIGGSGRDVINSITTDNINNIYLTGSFSDSINIDGTILYNPVKDILIAKLDENGALLWAKQASVNGNDGGYSDDIFSDNNENCYITGTFSGSASFGSFNITSSDSSDMFLAKYNDIGTCMGVCHFGTARGVNLIIDEFGNTICVGHFSGTVNIGNTTLSSLGLHDLYVAKSDSISGIHEPQNKSEEQLVIYANPTAGTCNIVIPDDFQFDNNLTLSIYDNRGRLIRQIPVQISNDEIKFNIEAEAKGIYNVILSNNKKQYSGKLIFE